MDRQSLGKAGEELAAREYTRRGYRLMDKNYRTRMGELDLVLEKGGLWVICEVKTRNTAAAIAAAEAVNYRKQQKIILATQSYLRYKNLSDPLLRFDVAEVYMGEDGAARVNIIENAFTL